MKKQKLIVLLICLFSFQFYLFDSTIIKNVKEIKVSQISEIDDNEINLSKISELNNSYSFNFNSKLEKISIQIKIFDINNEVKWLSNEFNNINELKLQEIDFSNLDSILIKTETYSLKVHKTYHHFESNNTQTSYIDNFIIN